MRRPGKHLRRRARAALLEGERRRSSAKLLGPSHPREESSAERAKEGESGRWRDAGGISRSTGRQPLVIGQTRGSGPVKKGICIGCLPGDLSDEAKLHLAK